MVSTECARSLDVKSLASAPENEVLKVWQGLGYYSRARNMQTAARQIMNEFNGLFPDTYINIVYLKGIEIIIDSITPEIIHVVIT